MEAEKDPRRASARSRTRYSAYLLRIWQDGERSPRRASLKEIRSGHQRYFNDLESLFLFLHQQGSRET